jgi:tetratricopeptide (TPR) repeat protein
MKESKRRAGMQDDHPTLETLARWLAGELEHEQVVRELAPHFLESCPVCREMRQEIDRLLAESGHWDEAVAVVETREAPELLGLLGDGPHAERMRRAEEVEELHTWGVCQLLLKKVREQVFSDPVQAVETAHLAVRLTEHLGSSYHPDWVLELRARAFAHLGNARRVLGELKAADDAFLLADECLQESGADNLWIEAEVLSLKGSLRLDQRRLEEAQDLVERALGLYRQAGDPVGVAKGLLQQSKILNQRGEVAEAIAVLQAASSEIDPTLEPLLFARARQNLLFSLSFAGRYEEAAQLLAEQKVFPLVLAEPLDGLRLRWTEANIAHGLGRLTEAEKWYRGVQREFLALGNGLDAALVSLDLATLFWEQGRTAELKQLAEEILLVFESQEVRREAMAALVLFQQACREDRITGEMLRQIAAQLRREQRG